MAKLPKKIVGVKTPIAIAALALIVGVLYLRHRAASAATSSAGPAASTLDSGLGSGGSGAVSTPSDNGVGSTTVGTDGTQSAALWDTLLSAYGISSQANAELASNAGTYTNYSTSTTYNYASGAPSGGYVHTATYDSLGATPTPITSAMVAPPVYQRGGYPNAFSSGNTLDAALHPGVYSQTVLGNSRAKVA